MLPCWLAGLHMDSAPSPSACRPSVQSCLHSSLHLTPLGGRQVLVIRGESQVPELPRCSRSCSSSSRAHCQVRLDRGAQLFLLTNVPPDHHASRPLPYEPRILVCTKNLFIWIKGLQMMTVVQIWTLLFIVYYHGCFYTIAEE